MFSAAMKVKFQCCYIQRTEITCSSVHTPLFQASERGICARQAAVCAWGGGQRVAVGVVAAVWEGWGCAVKG